MCIPFQTINPPTQGTKKAVDLLKYLAMAELVVILLKIVVIQDYGAFFELFLVFILYSSWSTLNYCSCVFFVIWSLYQELIIFVFFGTNVQDQYPFFSVLGNTTGARQAASIVYFILFFYYAAAAYVAFIAYKEFKILQFEMSGLPQSDGQQYQTQNNQQQQPQYQQQQQQQPQSNQFQAFQGRGQAIG